MTDGLFTQKIAELVLNGEAFGIPIGSIMRNTGNQISRQRMDIIANWYNNGKHEWLLSIDSDVIVELQTIKDLWEIADKNTNPVVSGIYYLFLQDKEGKIPPAFSSIFRTQNNFEKIESVDIEKEEEIFSADAAGFGLLLIHRSVIDKLVAKLGNKSNFFHEEAKNGNFIGEDIVFFKNIKDCGISLTVSKKATVQHMKRFSLGIEYFNLKKDR
jgi:hypothetical protein